MLLYDGTGADAHMVGLSYYIIKEGEAEPTDGFGGNNDHYHRHVGLCVKGAVRHRRLEHHRRGVRRHGRPQAGRWRAAG